MSDIAFMDYYDIIYYFNDGKAVIDSALDYSEDSVDAVVKLNVLYPELDLLHDFWDSYQFAASNLDSTSVFLGAVTSLQAHIMARGDWSSVSKWWTEQKIGTPYSDEYVPVGWSELSASAGYDYATDVIEV